MSLMDEDLLPGEKSYSHQVEVEKAKYNDAKNWTVNEEYDSFEMFYFDTAYFIFREENEAAHFKLVWGGE